MARTDLTVIAGISFEQYQAWHETYFKEFPTMYGVRFDYRKCHLCYGDGVRLRSLPWLDDYPCGLCNGSGLLLERFPVWELYDGSRMEFRDLH